MRRAAALTRTPTPCLQPPARLSSFPSKYLSGGFYSKPLNQAPQAATPEKSRAPRGSAGALSEGQEALLSSCHLPWKMHPSFPTTPKYSPHLLYT